MRRASALIIGGGPAGCAAAIGLARAGGKPLLLERHSETGDALCGGFLSWRTMALLQSLGVEAGPLHGHLIDRVRLFSGTSSAEARLPRAATGLSRRALDTALQAQALRAGATIDRGVAVRQASTSVVQTVDGSTIHCDSLFLATGKYDCRGLARPRDATENPALGLRLRLPAHPALLRLIGSTIELHLFRGGYAGLVIQEDGSVNFCMAVRKARLAEAGGDPWQLCRSLGEDAQPLAERLGYAASPATFDAVGAVPYGWRAQTGVESLYRLGDQAAVISSLAGEGIAIALSSGVMAAQAWHGTGAAGAACFQAALAQKTCQPVARAARLSALAERRWARAMALPLMRVVPGVFTQLAETLRIDPVTS